MLKRLFILASVVAICLLWTAGPASANSIFVTGHDPDYHAFRGANAVGAQHIIQRAINYITEGAVLGTGSLLLVTDRTNPGGDQSDPVLGLNAAGFSGKYVLADNGAAGGSVLDLHTVDFSSYKGIVVASDYGGWLEQRELDILNARSSEIIDYLNAGGGIFAMAENGNRGNGTGTTHDRFGFLPFLVADFPLHEGEADTVTPFGASLGLTNADVSGNVSHGVFTSTGGMDVVDHDGAGRIISLAARGTVTPTGVPEPATLTLLGLGSLSLLYARGRRRKRS